MYICKPNLYKISKIHAVGYLAEDTRNQINVYEGEYDMYTRGPYCTLRQTHANTIIVGYHNGYNTQELLFSAGDWRKIWATVAALVKNYS